MPERQFVQLRVSIEMYLEVSGISVSGTNLRRMFV